MSDEFILCGVQKGGVGAGSRAKEESKELGKPEFQF